MNISLVGYAFCYVLEQWSNRRGGEEGLSISEVKSFAPPLKDWRECRHHTGKWPLLSVVVYALQFPVMLVGIAFLVKYNSKYGWSNNKFVLMCLLPAAVFVWFWNWLQRTVLVAELRRYRTRSLGINR
jgi:hypothetical protein